MYSAGRTVVFSSLAFATVHASNPEASMLAWVNVMLVGAVLGQLREITGGILMPLGLHVGWNLSLGMIFGVRGFIVTQLTKVTGFQPELVAVPRGKAKLTFGQSVQSAISAGNKYPEPAYRFIDWFTSTEALKISIVQSKDSVMPARRASYLFAAGSAARRSGIFGRSPAPRARHSNATASPGPTANTPLS